MREAEAPARSGRDPISDVQYRAWQQRLLPPVEVLAGGIWSLPIPFTGHPGRYTLCYVLEARGGPVLIDPGWPGDISWEALVDGLATVGVAPADVRGVLVTHAHMDHHGLAWKIRKLGGAWVGMHAADATLLRTLAGRHGHGGQGSSFPDVTGTPPAEQAELMSYPPGQPLITDELPDRIVADGERGLVPGRDLVARWTPGHTPGHLCFVDQQANRVFTGDHLLPHITAHVGAFSLNDTDRLGEYLDSLAGMDYVDDSTEILPAHEYRFAGGRARIDVLQRHHRNRLDEIANAVSALGTATVWEVSSVLTWSRGWAATTGQPRRLALAETLAHLRRLEAERRVQRYGTNPPVWRPTKEQNA
jgi:glyoxylase-like metal-dependent hydrolase (beta-lactamase superfamily II)